MIKEMPPLPGSQEDRSEEGKDTKKSSKLKRLGAAVLVAGAMTYAPEGHAQTEIENPEPNRSIATQQEGSKHSIKYSDYIKVNPLPTGSNVKERLPRQTQAEKGDGSLRISAERTFDTRLKTAREGLRYDEALELSRGKLQQAFEKIAQETGADAIPGVQLAGNAIVSAIMSGADSRLSEAMRKAATKGMTAEEVKTLDFIRSGQNAENMKFTKQLGSKDNWKLTLGADPGISLGGKLNPKVGVTFRMSLP